MMREIWFCFLFFFIGILAYSQINGRIETTYGIGIPYASISVSNAFNTAVANQNGAFTLQVTNPGEYKIVVQQFGFETFVQKININELPYELNIVLKEAPNVIEKLNWEAPKQELTNEIIKNAIRNRKTNAAKLSKYTIDFYAKGFIKITNYPHQKFLGYSLEALDSSLKIDSLKSKEIVYNAEHFSQLSIEKPNKFKENVIASNVEGSNQGFAFISGFNADFNFYNNQAYPNWKLISPLAANALNYYQYKLEEEFVDPNTGKLIYKIKLTPRREKDPTVSGFIYIIDNTWEIYAIDAELKGFQIQIPQIDNFIIKQMYSYNDNQKAWYKSNQTIDFNGKILVFKYKSQFNYHYNNLEQVTSFPENTFSRQAISYEHKAPKRDQQYWNTIRPIIFTENETSQSRARELQIYKESTKAYKDSIDLINNRFNPIKLIQGYNYRNTYKNETYKYTGLLSTFAFNPVQGFNVTTGISYLKEFPRDETYYEVGGYLNYGTAENKPLFSGYYKQLFNRFNNSKLLITGGATAHQFGEDVPIKKLINSISTSWFGKNYAKFYQKNFVRTQFEIEPVNGFLTKIDLEYANRKPMYNNKTHSPFLRDEYFSSNNPIDPSDFTNAGFEQNHIFKLRFSATINFDQKYITYSTRKENIYRLQYPALKINYEKGFAASQGKLNYDLIEASTKYNTTFRNIGNLGLFINGGIFFNSTDIAFMDYKHFYGNQTFVGTTKNYLQNFNLMPYYSHSTNKSFVEAHMEHDFKGFLMNKVPLLNRLQWNLIIGVHALYTADQIPYYEYSIGFENFGLGKIRPIRIDYFRSYQGGRQTQGIIVGLKFLNGML